MEISGTIFLSLLFAAIIIGAGGALMYAWRKRCKDAQRSDEEEFDELDEVAQSHALKEASSKGKRKNPKSSGVPPGSGRRWTPLHKRVRETR
jgi:hypothetical protein